MSQRRYPEGITLPYYYIKLLDAADRAPPAFRFMDLPPESRNMVYSQLLTFSTKKNDRSHLARHCYPKILRTCRSINHEASDLPYANNTFQIILYAEWRYDLSSGRVSPMWKLFRRVWIQYRKEYSAEQTEFEAIPDGIMAWPDYLTRVRKLSLKLYLVQDRRCTHDHGSTAFAWRCISTLVAFLMGKHHLVDLDVVGVSPACLDVGLNGALMQLCRLKINGNVSVRGPDLELAKWVTGIMTTPGVSLPNVINEIKRVFDRADVLKAMQVSRQETTTYESDPFEGNLVSTMMTLIDRQRKSVLWSLSAEPGVRQFKDRYIYSHLEAMQFTIDAVEKYVSVEYP